MMDDKAINVTTALIKSVVETYGIDVLNVALNNAFYQGEILIDSKFVISESQLSNLQQALTDFDKAVADIVNSN